MGDEVVNIATDDSLVETSSEIRLTVPVSPRSEISGKDPHGTPGQVVDSIACFGDVVGDSSGASEVLDVALRRRVGEVLVEVCLISVEILDDVLDDASDDALDALDEPGGGDIVRVVIETGEVQPDGGSPSPSGGLPSRTSQVAWGAGKAAVSELSA